MERFWRNIFGKAAATRFHRPVAGQGLNTVAQRNIKSLRMLSNEFSFFESQPANELLLNRKENQAFCSICNHQITVFFTGQSKVSLKLMQFKKEVSVRWLDINNSQWRTPQEYKELSQLELEPPSQGVWAVLITAKQV